MNVHMLRIYTCAAGSQVQVWLLFSPKHVYSHLKANNNNNNNNNNNWLIKKITLLAQMLN